MTKNVHQGISQSRLSLYKNIREKWANFVQKQLIPVWKLVPFTWNFVYIWETIVFIGSNSQNWVVYKNFAIILDYILIFGNSSYTYGRNDLKFGKIILGVF